MTNSSFIRSAAAVLAAIFLNACAQYTPASSADLAKSADDTLGCQSFEYSFWAEMDKIPLENGYYPDEETVRASLESAFDKGRLSRLDAADRRRVSDAIVELYRILAVDAARELGVELTGDESSHIETLKMITALELGDRSTPEKAALQERIAQGFARIETIIGAAGPDVLPACEGSDDSSRTVPDESTPMAGTQFAHWKATRHPAVYGGLKTLAVSYQSCDVGNSSPLVRSTPNLEGIKIYGTASDGVGSLRKIEDLPALVRTHPYLSAYTKPAASCFDVKSKPLIYDYGGRPAIASTGAYDFFKNWGVTSVLGTDCSGFVYMALTNAGLRIKSGVPTRTATIYGVSSHLFFDPKANGWTCVDYAKFKGADTIRPGDIIAKRGHVVLVDTVGTDPFGIAGISKVEDCKLANMSASRFNFTILQSSPSKEGLGIHRAKIADWIPESPTMLTGLLEHAVNACKAKFNASTSITTRSTSASLTRHLGTAACKDSGSKMERESCVASCPQTAAR